MPIENDDIIVKRKKIPASFKEDGDVKKTSPKSKPKSKAEVLSAEYERNLKIFAILLALISVLIFISLISYTSADEANTEISFVDLFGLIKGSEAVVSKAQSTQNWLGLVGAFISNLLINQTIGFWILSFPLLMLLWSFSLYKNLKVSGKVIKITAFTIIFSFLMSAIIGGFDKINALTGINKEWIGSVGYFISTFTKNLLGTAGALLIFITLLAVLIILWTNISPENLYRNVRDSFVNSIAKFKKFKISTSPDKSDAKSATSNDSEPIVLLNPDDDGSEDSEEPARIIRRNIDYQINRPDSDNSLVHPFLGTSVSPGNPDRIGENFYNETDGDTDDQLNSITRQKLNDDYLNSARRKQVTDGNEFDETPEDDYPEDGILPDGKKLVLTVEEHIEDEPLEEVLSSWIHDEEINYKSPVLSLLKEELDKYVIPEAELKQNARLLQEKLETFKIYIENLKVTPGPVVTQYEFVPAAGIKISRIESLQDDIAMALSAQGIRIIAPIPGKGTVGIEIPNAKPAIVRFSSIVKSAKFNNNEMRLPLALGKTISGDVYVADLAKMPHLLIAGATGSGKSVGMNTIIASLLFRMHPKNLKFVFIDPKKVELRQYAQLSKHFLAVSPEVSDVIITDPMEAVIVLKSLCAEMELRYEIMASVRQRNIADYNEKVAAGAYKDKKDMAHRQMPFIVCIIDELADLMMTASKEVEAPIIRLAQLARAVGIHLVVATQRPSVDVITGIIKANFPSRIAYQVASKVDSRTILDSNGADQLLGDGDMLFHGGGVQKALRIQNSFITTDEVESLCEFIGRQKGYSQPYILPALNDPSEAGNTISKEDRDPLFEDSARLCIRHQQASVSLIQRRMKVGYARAGRIVDELEAFGVVGPYEGSKARSVLMESESELESVL